MPTNQLGMKWSRLDQTGLDSKLKTVGWMDGTPSHVSCSPWISGKVRARSSHFKGSCAREHVAVRQAHFKSLLESFLLTSHRSKLIVWLILKSMGQWDKYIKSIVGRGGDAKSSWTVIRGISSYRCFTILQIIQIF